MMNGSPTNPSPTAASLTRPRRRRLRSAGLALLPVFLGLAACGPTESGEVDGAGMAEGSATQAGSAAGQASAAQESPRIYGSFHFAESCSYDPSRDLYVAPNLANRGPGNENDGFVSLINPDGTVNTLRWIEGSEDGPTLDNPLGSDIVDGVFYVADANNIRSFDLETGEHLETVTVDGATGFNDIEVAEDGTIYATQTRAPERVYRVDPDGSSSIFVDGSPLSAPNGVAFDPQGNIVVVNVESADVLTFSPEGELLRTEQAHDPGNDGLVIMPDGTKYVSSVRNGTVGVIPPDGEAEVIATDIPSAASMCYDPTRNRLIVPMNAWNALAFVDLN